MGAIFIYKKGERLDINNALSIFSKKGCERFNKFNVGNWVVYFFNKQLLTEGEILRDKDGNIIFSVGTWVYKHSSNISQNLKTFLEDYKEGSVKCKDLIGQYLIIIIEHNKVVILTDPLYSQHIYTNYQNTVFSTSFLAVLSSLPYRTNLNELAFYEKITTGFIVAPDTLVEDIYLISTNWKWKHKPKQIEINSPCYKERVMLQGDIPHCGKNFLECVNNVAWELKNYFGKFITFANHYNTDIGVSGGFDSRLILSLFTQTSDKLPSIHTHLTKGVHEKEYLSVKKLTELLGTELKVIETEKIYEKTDDEIYSILEDGLYYYDGRNGYDTGGFSEVYTRLYWLKIFNNSLFSISGFGGELFRNDHCIDPKKQFDYDLWSKRYMYYMFNELTIKNKKKFKEMHAHLKSKIESILNLPPQAKLDFYTSRRYFSEIRMPFSDIVNMHAHNQLAFILAPFMDPKIIRLGYSATEFMGIDGEFEAELIKKVSPKLANIISPYGFTFANIPKSHIVHCKIKSFIPLRLLLLRQLFKGKLGFYGKDYRNEFEKLENRSRIISNIIKFLKSNFGGDFNWEYAIMDRSYQQANVVYVGYLLVKFSDKIKIVR